MPADALSAGAAGRRSGPAEPVFTNSASRLLRPVHGEGILEADLRSTEKTG